MVMVMATGIRKGNGKGAGAQKGWTMGMVRLMALAVAMTGRGDGDGDGDGDGMEMETRLPTLCREWKGLSRCQTTMLEHIYCIKCLNRISSNGMEISINETDKSQRLARAKGLLCWHFQHLGVSTDDILYMVLVFKSEHICIECSQCIIGSRGWMICCRTQNIEAIEHGNA